MSMRDMVPWGRGKKNLPANNGTDNPLEQLHREMNRLFDDFSRGWFGPLSGWTGGTAFPKVNVEDGKKEVRVSVELPGMAEKDVDVSVTSDTLTIQGEKKEEKEEKDKNYLRQERSCGAFRRVLGLPAEIDKEKATAVFKRGVLTLILPKSKAAQSAVRRIEVRKN